VTSKPDFKVMVLLLVFMQLTRDLFAIAKFLFCMPLAYLECGPGHWAASFYYSTDGIDLRMTSMFYA